MANDAITGHTEINRKIAEEKCIEDAEREMNKREGGQGGEYSRIEKRLKSIEEKLNDLADAIGSIN